MVAIAATTNGLLIVLTKLLSGIGLLLSRQIAEAHGGTLRLENRLDARGCRAVVTLPRHGHQTMTDSSRDRGLLAL